MIGLIGGSIASAVLLAAAWAAWIYVRNLRRAKIALTLQLAQARIDVAREASSKIDMATVFQNQTRTMQEVIDGLRVRMENEIDRGADLARANPSSAADYLRDSMRSARLPAFVPGLDPGPLPGPTTPNVPAGSDHGDD